MKSLAYFNKYCQVKLLALPADVPTQCSVSSATTCPLAATACPDRATLCPPVDFDDSDGDGVGNSQDSCPGSNQETTVIIDGCATGIENKALANGCSMNDLIGQCLSEAGNRGNFVSCAMKLVKHWKKEGLIPRGKH
jgi:hypothetical protein